ncbi:MAG: DUF1275 domain-containing protein [Synergistaceae bacterium]|nr:DUF1275 domain-containing protein [Synergistaceae bacterium]MBR0258019.1 DUF1275 domain-containing protein [Synergistaceae bacterium]
MPEKFLSEKHKELHNELHREHYLTCEKYYIFELLTVAGGMMGLYTYSLRGQVFCNAQTGNIVKMTAAIGYGNFAEAMYYFIPFTAYVLGTIISEILPEKVSHTLFIRWETALVGTEILVLFLIGFIPFSWPDQVVQVMINFLCAMQFNTFRQAEGIPMATLFVTNHVRQIGISIARIIKHHDQEAEARAKMLKHVKLILAFMFGGIIVTALSSYLKEHTIWLAIIPLSACFCVMLQSDLVYERTMLDFKAGGH